MNIINFRKIVTVVPTIDTSIYASGDQLGPTATKLAEVFRGPKDMTLLQQIIIIDADKQKSAIDFFFWLSKPTVTSVDNGAFALTEANLKAYFACAVSVAAGDYVDTSAQAVATKTPSFPATVASIQDTNNPTGHDLWMTMVSRGTPTYTGTTKLQIVFKFQ